MTKITPPNYTQIPNTILDDYLPAMPEAELRVTLAIARQTFGWHRKRARLSLTGLMGMTGLSKQGVINGVNAGLERGTIIRYKRGQGFEYGMKVSAELVNEIDQSETSYQSTKLTSTSQPSRPVLVNEVDHIKERKKEKEKGEGPKIRLEAEPFPTPTPTKPSRNGTHKNIDPRKLHGNLIPTGIGSTPYEVYREVFSSTPTKTQISAMMTTVTDLGKWRTVCNEWTLKGYRSNNFAGLLDVYENGWRSNNGYNAPTLTQAPAKVAANLEDLL